MWMLVLASLPFLQDPVESTVFERQAEAWLDRSLTGGDVTGVAVLVSLGDENVFEQGLGHLGGEPASVDAAVAAAPLTELLAVMCALDLVEKGLLDLEQPVGTYLPGLDFDGGTVLVRHLLAQTSGVPAYRGQAPDEDERPRDKTGLAGLHQRMQHLARYAPLLEALDGSSLEHEPGRCLTYSNSNVLLLGVLVEAISGKELAQLTGSTLAPAMELERTAFDGDLRAPREGMVELGPDARTLRASFAPLAGGRLRTSARDLLTLQRGILERRVLGEAATRHMLGEKSLDDGSPVGFGFGIGATELEGHAGYHYGGRTGSSWIHVAHYPVFDTTIALVAEGSLERIAPLERQLVRLLFDLPGEAGEARELDPVMGGRYVGLYQLGCNRLSFLLDDGALLLDSALHGRRGLDYLGGHTFVDPSDRELRIRFEAVDGEPAHSVIIEEAGVHGIASRIPD